MTENSRITQFILVLMLLTIPFYVINGLTQNFPKILPMNLALGSLAIVCPFITAILLVHKDDGLKAVKSLLKDSLNPKGFKKIWLLAGLLIMPAILLGSYAFLTFQGINLPQTNFSAIPIVLLFILFFIAAFFEEVGWMGFLFPRLEKKFNVLLSGLLLGIIWSSWHIVLYIQNGHSLEWVVWQCLFSISARLLIVWIYENNEKSVLSAIIFHTMLNVSITLFPIDGSFYDPISAGFLTAMLVIIVLVFYDHNSLTSHRFKQSLLTS